MYLTLKRNFCSDVNGRFRTTCWVTLKFRQHSEEEDEELTGPLWRVEQISHVCWCWTGTGNTTGSASRGLEATSWQEPAVDDSREN